MSNKINIDDFALNGGEKLFDSFRSTMNLPAPTFELFYDKVKFYRQKKDKAPVADFEFHLSKYHNVSHVVCFSSCFTAMAITLKTLAISGKKEVILPSLTYRRMSEIVLWAGLEPCFCDNDPKTFGISADAIKDMINDNTAMILAPHPLVKLSNINEILKVAKEANLPIMFDSVEANGSIHNDVTIGGYGDAESFSLHPSKLINACEGGYIATNNNNLYEALVEMRKGKSINYNGGVKNGHFSKMNDLHAIMGMSSLETVFDTIQQNKDHYNVYKSYFDKINGLNIVLYDENERRNYKTILVEVTEEFCLSRDELFEVLNPENVFVRKFYAPAQHLTQIYKSKSCKDTYEVAELLQHRFLLFPLGHTVSESDIHQIGKLLNEINNIYTKMN